MLMKVLRWIDANFEKVFLCIALAVIAIALFVTIVLRNVFSYSIAWSDELARFFFIWTGAIGVSYATKNNSHLRMDILPVLVPKLQKPLAVVCDIALAVIAIMIINGSLPFLKLLNRTGQLSGGMQLPMKYFYMSFQVGFALTLFRLVQRYVLLLVGFVKKNRKQKEEK